MHYLALTDAEVAKAKGEYKWEEYVVERTEAREFLTASGSIDARKQTAKASKAVEDAQTRYTEALVKYEEYLAKRKRAELTVDVWRTQEASRRAG
jgi:hypothetical protein